MKRFFLFLILPFTGSAQFAPAAGLPGTTAIHKDSSAIVAWASGCTVTRGYQNIANPSAGTTTVGVEANACGPADIAGVISLGDAGTAVLTFPSAIRDLPGPDFCVFENSFDPGFLELAFVEVSSNGINFTRFPAVSNVQNTVQIGPFDTNSDASKINNLAGKYVGGYGVPFDLQELTGTSGLDLQNITHVRIIDVIGCIQPQIGSFDFNNNVINDPWATEFGSGGFDLDAVGVIHRQPVGVKENQNESGQAFVVYPAVTRDFFRIRTAVFEFEIEIRDTMGCLVAQFSNDLSEYNIAELPSGIYFVYIKAGSGYLVKKIMRV